uniref:Uncharacterized protein n=1 Tax=Phlebotomus papatasi TaxID=29031 RepID=A0A1B0DDH1_PHLPP
MMTKRTTARDHNELPGSEAPLTNGLDHTPTHLQNGEPAEGQPQGSDPEENKYVPKSPALARYSPVYSPETGRVKIKLTETPKPKTPLLVTRSRSNAGEIITTPYTSPIRDTPEKAEENRATVILLVVVGVALVGLVAFIITKRRKRSRRNRADAENPRGEELLDMDKKLLGKPVQKNGNPESAPLMPNRDKSDYARPVNGDKVDTAAPISNYERPPSPKKVEEPVQKRENVPTFAQSS